MTAPSIRLRAVGPGDEPFLATVYAATRAEEMAIVPWNEGEKQEFLEFQRRAQTQSYTTRFPDSEHNVVLVDDEPAGRIWTAEGDDEIRLLDIALLPEFRNRGVGTVVLSGLQDRSRASGKTLRHMVASDNQAAIRFYERLGFVTAQDDSPTHLLMEWAAS